MSHKFCTQCGERIQATERFCGGCGRRLLSKDGLAAETGVDSQQTVIQNFVKNDDESEWASLLSDLRTRFAPQETWGHEVIPIFGPFKLLEDVDVSVQERYIAKGNLWFTSVTWDGPELDLRDFQKGFVVLTDHAYELHPVQSAFEAKDDVNFFVSKKPWKDAFSGESLAPETSYLYITSNCIRCYAKYFASTQSELIPSPEEIAERECPACQGSGLVDFDFGNFPTNY